MIKQVSLVILALITLGCSDSRSLKATVTAIDGTSTFCTVTAIVNGALLSCSDGSSVEILNGINGQDGATGPQGETGLQGPAGSSATATIVDYSAVTCTSIAGTTSYVKKSNNNFAIYTTSNCASNSKIAEVSQGEAYWVSGTTLATHTSTNFRVIIFN